MKNKGAGMLAYAFWITFGIVIGYFFCKIY